MTPVLSGTQRPQAPGRASDRIRAYGQGRTCEAPGCATLLSIYNPSRRCSLHGSREQVSRRHQRTNSLVEERRCAHCGAVFSTGNVRRKYCGDRCRVRAFMVRRRSGEAAA